MVRAQRFGVGSGTQQLTQGRATTASAAGRRLAWCRPLLTRHAPHPQYSLAPKKDQPGATLRKPADWIRCRWATAAQRCSRVGLTLEPELPRVQPR
jgi:hypothetical protein